MVAKGHANWPTEKLEDVCSQITDGKHGDCQNEPDSGFYFLSCKDVVNGKLNYEGARQITEADFLDTHRRTKFAPSDILITNSGTIGRMAIAPDNDLTRRTTFQKSVAILKPLTSRVDPNFLYYGIQADLRRLSEFGSGTAQKNLLLRDLRAFEVSVPPLPTQRRIAGILSAYDDLIENSQRRIKILESMARALYREWFVHFRFPGHESVPRIPSPMGEIPQGWEVRLVEEIVKRIPVGKKYDQKTVASTGTVPVFDQGKSGIIGYHDDDPGVVASETAPVIVFANHTCYQRIIHIPFSAIQNVLPFVPSPLLYRDIYWLHWATDGLVVFNDYKGHWPEFAAKTLIVPNAEMCQQFGEFAAPLSLHILRLERQIQNLRRTRDLLLPRLLSGQIDVESLQ
jgi:type I restriction enzyme, S subunit